MDPVAAWKELTDALASGDHATAKERAKALIDWIGKSGFNPINCSHSGAVALLAFLAYELEQMFALMMRCRTGTRYLCGEAWHDVMTTITVSGHPTEAEAYREAVRLAPRGFNRERISLWVVPWNERFA